MHFILSIKILVTLKLMSIFFFSSFYLFSAGYFSTIPLNIDFLFPVFKRVMESNIIQYFVKLFNKLTGYMKCIMYV